MNMCEAYSTHTAGGRGSSDVIQMTECVAYERPGGRTQPQPTGDPEYEIVQ